MAKKANSKRKQTAKLASRLAANLIMILIITACIGFGVYKFRHQHIESGQFRVSDTFLGENLFDSLDLKVAAKAAYPSQPVKLIKDLGTDNGIDRQHFSFSVQDDNLTEYGLVTL